MKICNCSKCDETNPDMFYRTNKSKCKSCLIKECVIRQRLNPEYQKRQAKYYRDWYARNGRKRSVDYTDIIILWRATHRDSVRTMRKVRRAIEKGLLERPLSCAMCGREKCRINAHHDDCNFPYDVMWLCSSCHKKIHFATISLDKS